MAAAAAARSFPRMTRSLQSRGYATQQQSSGGSSALPIAAGLAALGAGAYFFLGGSEQPASLKKAEKTAAEATGLKSTPTEGAATALDPKNFRNFKLKSVLPYNHDSSRFVFELPANTDSGLTVASAVLTRAANAEDLQDDSGKPVIRPYTPTTSPNTEGVMEFLVKRYENGKMSKHFHDLKPGDELAIKGPIKKIDYKPNTWSNIGLVVGGSGFTPAWQILQAIDANPDDKTKAKLIFANKTEDDILLRKELEDMAKRRPGQIELVFVLDKAAKDFKGETGYVTHEMLAKHLPPAGLAEKTKIFVCGPPPQVTSVAGAKDGMKQGPLKGLLADLGYTESQVFKF